jgi:threonine/homoserine/homoserine lactone efflux protein
VALIGIKARPAGGAIHVLMEIMTFLLASVVLLATPGPTNTLLFTSGAAAGLRPALPLLLAELLGYLVSINLLTVALVPLLAGHAGLGIALQVACAAYLLYAARRLWVNGTRGAGDQAVTFGRVFVTTLFNPKAIIFASAIIPGTTGLVEQWPWLAALSLIIAAVGASWIGAGAMVRAAWAGGGALVCRLGAAALMAFASLMSWSAIASAFNL